MKTNMTFTVLLVAIVAAVTLASCSVQTTTQEPTSSSSFSSAAELKAYLADHSGASSGGIVAFAARDVAAPAPTAAANTAAGSGTAESAKSVSYTGTNNQVAGVDEADSLKTNGNYIFTITGQGVTIIKSLPANETSIVGNLSLDWYPQALLLSNDTLYVIGNEYKADTYTIVVGYDLSDPEHPKELFTKEIEGSYVTGRFTNQAYIVAQSMPDWSRPIPMPYIVSDGVRSNVAVDRIMLPRPVSDARYLTVASIAPNGTIDSTSIITDGYPTVYASQNAIYLAMARTVNEWQIRQRITYDVVSPMLSSDETTLIGKINGTDPEVLSQSEKDSKIGQVLGRYLANLDQDQRAKIQDAIDAKVKDELKTYDAFEHTDLIKVPYDTLEASKPVTIKGTVNDQFSLDERNGTLRVATTTNPRWTLGETQDDIENHIYTIKDGKILDELDGLAKGERIYSARYTNERLYLVTYKQVDPFFVIDLSDPTHIETLGELKLPGFSRYLHPYSDNVIIGLGRNASETGRQTGLKLSLFDVSDPSTPKEISSWVSDERYASSQAEWDHKAFLLDKRHDLLVIPISGSYSYDPMPVDGTIAPRQQTSGGALVFTITDSSVTLRGLVEHPGYGGVERSLVIEDSLYTKSPTLLRVNRLSDLKQIASVTLSSGSPYRVY